MVGRYIDALSDEQRDRIIEAEEFNDENRYFDDNLCGCLVGIAERESFTAAGRMKKFRPVEQGVGEDGFGLAGDHFYHLCRRFGKDRIVALCKARAAKGNAGTVRQIRDGIYREMADR